MISLHRRIQDLFDALGDLKTAPMVGGWEATLRDSVVIEHVDGEQKIKLKNIELSSEELERRGAHLKNRDCKTFRLDIIQKLLYFLEKRFEIDDEFVQLITPFVNFDKENVNLIELHKFICPDLDISSLALQFNELCKLTNLHTLSMAQLVSHLDETDKTRSYQDILTVSHKFWLT